MTEPLLPPRFLFRMSVPCRHSEPLWGTGGAALGDEHILPLFEELDGGKPIAEVRAGWSEAGVAFAVPRDGKRRPAMCDDEWPANSDGLQIWIDNRDTHNVHWASRHRFVFLPFGGGRKNDDPVIEQLGINRAASCNAPFSRANCRRSEKRIDGYVLEVLHSGRFADRLRSRGISAPRVQLPGARQRAGGADVRRRRRFPFEEDPSIWGTLELVR